MTVAMSGGVDSSVTLRILSEMVRFPTILDERLANNANLAPRPQRDLHAKLGPASLRESRQRSRGFTSLNPLLLFQHRVVKQA